MRGVRGAIKPVGQRPGKRNVHFHQRQPGQLGIHRGLVAPQFRPDVFPATVRANSGRRRFSAARPSTRPRSGFWIATTWRSARSGWPLVAALVTVCQTARGRPPPVCWPAELQRVAKFGARHLLVGRQLEAVDLLFRNLPHLGVMLRHQFSIPAAACCKSRPPHRRRPGRAAARRPADTGAPRSKIIHAWCIRPRAGWPVQFDLPKSASCIPGMGLPVFLSQ